MKKKRIIAALIALALTASLSVNAFAAGHDNQNGQDTEITAPGHKEDLGLGNGELGYTDGGANDQTPGASYGQATAESVGDGDEWTVLNDDDGVDESTASPTNKTDINVWAKISDASTKIYKIDIAWGSMKFEFNDGLGAWDVTTHTYGTGSAGTVPHWINSSPDGTALNDSGSETDRVGYIDEVYDYEVGTNGTNNRITVTNHSNSAVDAAFVYAMVNNSAAGTAATLFNDGGGDTTGTYGNDYGDGIASGDYDTNADHDVIGYFYGDNDAAALAHTAIANTHSSGTPTNSDAWTLDDGGADWVTANVPASTMLARLTTVDDQKVTDGTVPAITLPTAEMIDDGSNATDWNDAGAIDASELETALTTWNNTKWANGPRSANVYFAFSGQPDKGQGTTLKNFTKVGVITVTITPNAGADYNRPVAP